MQTAKKAAEILVWVLICILAGIFGAQFDPGNWYDLLQKPAWTPPNWIFPVVWPILYVMMGISAWFVWRLERTSLTQPAFIWFFLQLLLNALWSWLFFGMNLIGTALAEILLLWIAVVFTIFLFWDKSRVAGLLLIPYLLWMTYASALNMAIWQLN